MRLKSVVGISLASFVLVLTPVSAHHCTSYSTSVHDFPDGEHFVYSPEAHTPFFWTKDDVYLVMDFCQPDDCALYGAIYENSNGIPGLQRVDSRVNDLCHDSIQGDTLTTEFGWAWN